MATIIMAAAVVVAVNARVAAVARVAIKEKNEDFAIIFYKNSNPF